MKKEYTASPDRYEAGMKYRRAGKSGIQLPEISLGLWHNFGGVDSLERSRDMLHYAFDNGITHFDLANNYGPPYGSAEDTFGIIMQQSLGKYRHELFISTKAGFDMWPGLYGEWGSRKYLISSLDQSLKRMNLDYVDIFYSHRYDPNTPIEETMQALVDIVRSGKALYVGISRYPHEAAKIAYDYLRAHDTPCLAYQGAYNMFNREMDEDDIFTQAEENGSGITIFSPLAEGLLTNRYIGGIPSDSRIARGGHLKQDSLTEDTLDKIVKVNAIAEQRGEPLSTLALNWVARRKEVTSVIIGASSVKQLADNINSIHSPALTTEELKAIDDIFLTK